MQREHRIDELFAAALALDAHERPAFVESSTATDPELRAELVSLLEHHAAADGFMSQPLISGASIERVPSAPKSAAAPPASIGGFTIERELGRGGMGVVYLARQEHPRRPVALKVIGPGLASERALKRFEHEAQLLARLQHPGIAQIFEAGTADYGAGPQPYFAMEYVSGRTLAQYVADRALGTRERLALLADVCDALDHAHHRGVVHRDLKPSNILVDESATRAQIKVLDFGIARATDGDVQATSLRTDIGQVIGTLPYMSPEQAGGDPTAIDHRSDVYSLGVVGYEMLCGHLPLDVVGKPLHEAVRIVREDEPTPLSRVLPVLRGDVETIFAKALEKDRERRYASAAELAADLRRYLSDRPIVARPASNMYVLSKFARRNKVLVGGIAGVFVALVIGMAGTSWQAHVAAAERDRADEEGKQAKLQATRADQEARRAKAVAQFQREMLSRVQPDLDGREVKLVTVLDAAAAALPGEHAGDPATEGGVRETLGESYLALGLLEPAEEQFRRAWSLLGQSLGPNDRQTLQALNWLATTLADRGKLAEALELSEQAYHAWHAQYGRRDPESLVVELDLAQAYAAVDRIADAERLARENLALRREVFGTHDARYLNGLNVLSQLLRMQGRFEEALPLTREAFEQGRVLEGANSLNTLTRGVDLGGLLCQLGQLDEAEKLFRHALEVGDDLLGEEHVEVLAWKHNLAALLERQGRFDEAEALYRAVLTSLAQQIGDAHANTCIVMENFGGMLGKQRRFRDAELVLRRLFEARKHSLGPDDAATLEAQHAVGCTTMHAGDASRALPDLRDCVERGESTLPRATVAEYREDLAHCLRALGKLEDAQQEFAAVLESLRASLPDDDAAVMRVARGLRDVALARGDESHVAELDRQFALGH